MITRTTSNEEDCQKTARAGVSTTVNFKSGDTLRVELTDSDIILNIEDVINARLDANDARFLARLLEFYAGLAKDFGIEFDPFSLTLKADEEQA